jgi:hypothetical protein
MCSLAAVLHPATFIKGPRFGGQRARLINLELNHTDVCAEVFALTTGASQNLLRNACEQVKDVPRASSVQDYSVFLQQAHELNSDIDILHVVQWILDYCDDSGAEQIPMFEDLQRAAQFQAIFGSVDKLSLRRLNEYTSQALFEKYVQGSDEGRKFPLT